MPTIIDVATAAGVSTATVSRAMSQPDRVAPTTRERVLRAVDALGYLPNGAARTLRTLRAAKILVTVPDISNPFFASVIRGAEEAARDSGFGVVLGDTRHDAEIEEQYGAMLLRREVDGLVFLGHRLPHNLRDLTATPHPPIVNGCEYSGDLGVPSVHIDNAAASADAIDHLVGLGHRAIGVVTGLPESPPSRDRLAGAHAAAARHGIHLQVAGGDYSAGSGFEGAARLIAAGVTAIFCFSDVMALGALRAVGEAGLSCPDQVSVIGFDDLPLAAFFQPALTTIAQPKELIGRKTIELLVDVLAGAELTHTPAPLAHELVVRGTTARAG